MLTGVKPGFVSLIDQIDWKLQRQAESTHFDANSPIARRSKTVC
jgi:hypothetical protein